MTYQTIRLSLDNQVAYLTLHRPEALNAFNPTMVGELTQALETVAADESVKALVIRGEGRAFCAGADLLHLEEVFDAPADLKAFLRRANDNFLRLEALLVPVVAVVHGYCLAGGLELVLACDLVIAAEDAQIGDQHANFGLMPGGGSTQRLPRKIGHQRAMELILTGVEAAQCGLALRAVPPDQLDAALEALLAQLRVKSRTGMGWIKSAVNQGLDLPLRDGIALEIDSFVEYSTTSPHPKEGIQAFKERRQPSF